MYWNSKGDSSKLTAYYAACEKVKLTIQNHEYTQSHKRKHETSGINTLVFDNGGSSGGNGRVTTKGTIGEISAVLTHLQSH